ncbi:MULTISPECIES: Gfo/Idh/MocA family protein [unclassified Mameliella]|uniref:Gfo/Idh/MocA family protein n=1 Tax=unclassified Mameliella TaxID=2630630 RepID=UPI00273DD086|nr:MULTISPECIES: Gfo/Idh/MocA family oxidoreductase [unclassified Mameliella]
MTEPTETGPIGIALIGAGMIAKTHIRALGAMQDIADLKAIVSRNPDKARPLAEFYDGPPPAFTADLAAVANDPSVEIAIVATPPNVRKAVIEPLVRAGKHILLEKPVARTVQEACEIAEICERAGVTLGVLFQHRVRAPSRAAARLVAGGTLGALGLVEISVPLWRDQSYYDELGRGTYDRDGGGVMITNAVHSIDLALSLTGPVTRVQAMTATTPLHQMEAEDLAVSGLEFACGAVGTFVASTAMFPHRTEVIRLHHENASLKIDKNGLEVSWRDGRIETEAQAAQAGPVRPLTGNHEWHGAVISDFVESVRSGGKPLVTAREALRSHRVIEAIHLSSQSGSSVNVDL